MAGQDHNSRNDSRIRNRGVRASRSRLERALAASDLEKKTQAALANRIADLEDLDAAPKDLVSKVFREHPVDPQTLERIARALGVEARALYRPPDPPLADTSDPPTSGPSRPPSPPDHAGKKDRKVIGRLVWPATVLALLLAGFTIWGLTSDRDMVCAARETLHPLATPDHRLGIVIGRFADDPGNLAQDSLVGHFLNDPQLGPFVTVLRTCGRPSLSGPGDITARLERIRHDSRQKLRDSGSHILLWGRRDGDRLLIRFVSAGPDLSPLSLDIGGRPTRISEMQLEIPLSLNAPGATLPDVKKLALELMEPERRDLLRLRRTALKSYQTSVNWLRASIVGDRNVKRAIDPGTDPQLWALINGQLCYKQRLLGDYDADVTQYHDAEQSCRDGLSVRDRQQFPRDWAILKINLASALTRLHMYAASPQESLNYLLQAENAMIEAAEVLDRQAMPQLWALQKRNMGAVYMRLGELSRDAVADEYFNRGLKVMQEALEVLDPEFQPVDWALTQQNICASLYRKGYNQGADGAALVQLAVGHCTEALRWLDPDKSGLTWAMVQNNLAVSRAILAQLEKNPDQLTRAITEFRKAQQVYRRADFPANWAEVEINLGELHCNLAVLKQDPALLDKAIALSEQALAVLIEKKLSRYQRYLEGMLITYKSCRRDSIDQCRCAPAESG